MHKTGALVPCARCQKVIYKSGCELKPGKTYYCSLQCRITRVVVFCSNCGKPLTVKKCHSTRQYYICSPECRSQYRIKYFDLHPELREHLRQLATGKKKTPEQIAKFRAKVIGQKRTPEQRAKIAAGVPKGPNNPAWKGGISSFAYRLRRSVQFKEWRKAVFERDNYTCQNCGRRGIELHPHHQIQFSILLNTLLVLFSGYQQVYERLLAHPILWSVVNGQTLCKECHIQTPTFARNTT